MGRLILERVVATVAVLVLVTAGVFALIHLTPGDPIDAMMAESVDDTVKATMRKELGLDRPIYLQYAAWMGRVLQGDLGRSIRNREPVIENVGRRIRPSLELAALAMVIAIAVAFPVGIVSAARRHSAIDSVGTTFALFGICMPNFLIALLLIFLFGVALAAVITRTLRSSMLDALAEDYVRTARAKGLSEWRIIRGHALRNALIPVVTVMGLQLGTLI